MKYFYKGLVGSKKQKQVETETVVLVFGAEEEVVHVYIEKSILIYLLIVKIIIS